MRRIISLILLLAIIGQTFNQGFYYLNYLVDKATYLKNCENKARPMLHCDGKCQLMKQIREQEKKEQQSPELKLAKSEIFSSHFTDAVIADPTPIAIKRIFSAFAAAAPVDQPAAIFHPPGC